MENVREEEAKVAGKRFRPAIEPPYRWRDWAAKPDGITGPELIAFINLPKSSPIAFFRRRNASPN